MSTTPEPSTENFLARNIEKLRGNYAFLSNPPPTLNHKKPTTIDRLFRLKLTIPITIISSYMIYQNLANTTDTRKSLENLHEFSSTPDYLNDGAIIHSRKSKTLNPN